MTEETAAAAVQSYGDPLALPPDRLVWYIRTYAPVTLTDQSGAFLPSDTTRLYEAHGLAFIVDAATGQEIAMAAFS